MTTAKRDHPPPSPSSFPPDAKKARSSPFVHSTPTPSTASTASEGQIGQSSNPAGPQESSADGIEEDDGFTKVLTKEERRKMKKLDKNKPSFQFDLAQFRSGKKIGIAHVRDFVLHLLVEGSRPQWIVTEVSNSILGI